MPEPNPTVRARQLGAELKRLREKAGMTGTEAARRLGISHSKISRLENGKRGLKVEDVAALLALYRVTGGTREELLDLCRGSHERGWWQQYGSRLSDKMRTLIEFETTATKISNYETVFIPGLLQTGEYTRAVMQGVGLVVDSEIEDRMVTRMARQTVLSRSRPPRFMAVIDERALRTNLGGPDVMRRQLHALVDAASRPNITVRVVPLSVDSHPGLNGPFVILDFAEAPTVVCLENRTSSLFLENPKEIAVYRMVLKKVSSVALDQEKSVELIATLARELE